jgi:hypothetical protein
LACHGVALFETASVASDKAFIDACLGLIAQIVVNARDHNNQPVARISGLTNRPV